LKGNRAERRISAILAADVVGYSRLMGADDEGTLVQLKAHHNSLVEPKIKEYRGHIVRTTGDGLLFYSRALWKHCVAQSRSSEGWPSGMLGSPPKGGLRFEWGSTSGTSSSMG
jgi:class 3 adenylate cyclase